MHIQSVQLKTETAYSTANSLIGCTLT